MKLKALLITVSALACGSVSAGAIDQLNMGLGDDAVFNDPSPASFDYPDIKPGKADVVNPSYHTLPPMVPHRIKKYLPITAEMNDCLDCHDEYDKIGSKYEKGDRRLPMPKSHYGGFTGKGIKDEVSGSRYTCVQCHLPASDAKPLVENTFK